MKPAHTLVDQAFQQLVSMALGWLLGTFSAALRRRFGALSRGLRSLEEPRAPGLQGWCGRQPVRGIQVATDGAGAESLTQSRSRP